VIHGVTLSHASAYIHEIFWGDQARQYGMKFWRFGDGLCLWNIENLFHSEAAYYQRTFHCIQLLLKLQMF